MTTYGEYAMKHPLVELDGDAFYHEITPKAYKKPIAFTQEQIESFVSDLGQNQPQLWRK